MHIQVKDIAIKMRKPSCIYLMLIILGMLICFLPLGTFAQGIKGQILDNKGLPCIQSFMLVYQEGILRAGTQTDYDGNYVVKPLAPGEYSLYVIRSGYDTLQVPVTVYQDSFLVLNYQLDSSRKNQPPTPFYCNIGGISKYILYGKVMNEYGKILPGATLSIYRNNRLYYSTTTDKYGHYEVSFSSHKTIPDPGILKVFYPGYDTITIRPDIVENKAKLNIRMKPITHATH